MEHGLDRWFDDGLELAEQRERAPVPLYFWIEHEDYDGSVRPLHVFSRHRESASMKECIAQEWLDDVQHSAQQAILDGERGIPDPAFYYVQYGDVCPFWVTRVAGVTS